MSTFKVTISAGDGGSVSPDGEVEVPEATDLWIYAAPEAGRKVAEWYHDGQPWGCDVASYVIRGIARDAVVHVTFAPITHSVTTTPCVGGESTGGTVSPCSSLDEGPIPVDDGASLTFTARPDPGWRVGVWTVDGKVAARATETFTLPRVTADHSVAVTFDLPVLDPVRWRGTVTVTWKHRSAPPSTNTTQTADIILTQADLDESGAPKPVRAVKGGSERHQDTRTEQVRAVLTVGPTDAEGHVGTVDLWRHDRAEHSRTQQVRAGVPARRRRVTHTHIVESYPAASHRPTEPCTLWATDGDASVSVTYEDGQWRLAVRLAPPGVDGQRLEDSYWTVSGQSRPPSEPIATTTRLTTTAFERRLDTGVTRADVTRLKGRRTIDPGAVVVSWDLRLE